MKDVTAAILVRAGKVLVARRAPGQRAAGGWEFPGGKVEPGETPEECLRRELHEEFGITASVGAFVAANEHHYEGGAIRLLAYRVESSAEDFALTVHDRIAWVGPGELPGVALLPADIPIARAVAAALAP